MTWTREPGPNWREARRLRALIGRADFEPASAEAATRALAKVARAYREQGYSANRAMFAASRFADAGVPLRHRSTVGAVRSLNRAATVLAHRAIVRPMLRLLARVEAFRSRVTRSRGRRP